MNTKCLDFNRRDCSVHYVKVKSYCPTCFKHYCMSDEGKKAIDSPRQYDTMSHRRKLCTNLKQK